MRREIIQALIEDSARRKENRLRELADVQHRGRDIDKEA